ncbi:MAG: hypothetical protein NCW75_04010 [Phycisphaera sp.]|nr:MAG: hypothetical protein NCW75_04010 [Phycisphaera sp.]
MTINPTKLWLPVGSVTAAAGAMLIAGFISSTPKPTAAGAFTARAILQMVTPELHDVDRELRRVGITPEALAVVGVDAVGTTGITTKAVTHLDVTNYTSLRQAMAAHGSAKAEMQRLQRAFRAGTPGEATQQHLDDAIALEASTRATMEARQGDLFDAATDGLGGNILADLADIKSERDLRYPEYYKVADRTHAQAIALRDALNGVRIDAKLGQDPLDHHQTIISDELAKIDVAAAKTSFDTNLDAIVTAWQLVLDPA